MNLEKGNEQGEYKDKVQSTIFEEKGIREPREV